MKSAIARVDFLHARLNKFAVKVQKSRDLITRALQTTQPWAISFSGGKDSTCLLHLVRKQDPNAIAFFVHSGTEFPETLSFIESTPNVTVLHPTMTLFEMYELCGDYGCIENPPAIYFTENQIVETINREPIGYTNKQLKICGNFTGLRMQESQGREWFGKAKRGLWQQKDSTWRCEPLLQWDHNDVWAYIAANGIAYNRAYDIFASEGIPRKEWRVSPYAGSTGLGLGRWALLKRCWPELFNKFSGKFLHVKSYC